MTEPPPAIALDAVSRVYDGAAVVEAVTLSIPKGQFVALVGGSGAGKTTLLKMINALVVPTMGTVRLDGAAIDGLDGPTLRRRIGYVFQEVGLFPHLTVAENIGMVPSLLGWDAATTAARVDALLDLTALPRDLAGRLPAQLSGGQRQRVGVARALAAKPGLLLMDEPFGALDPVTRATLADDVRRLHDQLDLTTVMVTHDVAEAVLLADRVVVMAGGKVIADDTPRALLAGHADPCVEALMSAPRRQAQRVAALLAGEGGHG
jgi:osmoprotectant transport system ATP-binding protein